ncbi:MAG: protein kinase domain-containing protein [Prosthecobacter sp.]|uniref:protein kinase domain-containing protein n=1 Tax=Prosthecobacter sp. TaxID=1965333 RepID=UPI003901AB89
MPEELQAQMPQFKVLELIGRGGMGAVYRCWQNSLERHVAVKVLPQDFGDESDKSFSNRFKREAKTMAQLSHPGIVPVFDAGETAAGLPYFVMEFIQGTDVAQILREQGRMPLHHVLSVGLHVCDALAYAHKQGVVHRDIKPGNVMIDARGRVRVADFGLAQSLDHGSLAHLTRTNIAMGTPDFIAPEAMIQGMKPDHRADLYSVGVMLYNMMTGTVPRGMFKMPSQKVGSDPRLDEIIAKAMQHELIERYQTAAELRHDLDVILNTPLAVIETAAEQMQQTIQLPKSASHHPASFSVPEISPSARRPTSQLRTITSKSGIRLVDAPATNLNPANAVAVIRETLFHALKTYREGLLNTVNSEGRAHSSWMGAVCTPDFSEIITLTGTNTDKTANIRANPKVEWMFNSPDHSTIIYFEGNAEILVDDQMKNRYFELVPEETRGFFQRYFQAGGSWCVIKTSIDHAVYCMPSAYMKIRLEGHQIRSGANLGE